LELLQFQWSDILYRKANRLLTRFMLAVSLGLTSAVSLAGIENPGAVKDLHYGEVLFYFYQQDYFTAITRLLASRRLARMPNHRVDAELLLGGMDLSYGLHQEAGRIFQELLDGNTEERVRNRAWYYLGKISYQRGYLDRAEDYLQRLSGAVQEEVRGDQQLLLAQVLMEKGRFADAVGVLQAWEGPKLWQSYAQYNLGIALIELGGMDARNNEQDALKDKANLVLGYTLIEAGKPDQAKAHLQRVRLRGPYSNMALLGAGWADAELNRHQQALVPWTELHGRDVMDASVQESMLALPYAYSRLGAHGRAANLYHEAILSYTGEIRRLKDSISSIRDGGLVKTLMEQTTDPGMGWFWTLQELPDLPETRYLTHLMADHDFQEAVKNFRDLGFLAHNLVYWLSNIEVFDHMLNERRRRYRIHLPRAQQILAQANLSEVSMEHDALSGYLNNIERNDDSLSLATHKQRKIWTELEQIQRRLDVVRQMQEAPELEHKRRLIKGVLIWDLNEQFAERVWENRKLLNQLDAAIEAAGERRDSLERAVSSVPERFEGFGARIKELRSRIESQSKKVSVAMAALGEHLAHLAVVELERREQQLGAHITQARFSLAQSYDLASSREGK
jgi:tetratricopeptide (TPR) repeat protein